MFAYCLNNPANGSDPCGTCFHRWDFWNDCAKCGGATIGDKWNNYIAVTTNIYQQQAAMEFQINSHYVKAVQHAISAAQHAYDVRNQLEAEIQRVQYEAFVDRFSTPEKASNTLNGVAVALGSAAAYCGAVAVKLHVPTLGMSTIVAEKIGGALTLAAVPFAVVAWIIDVCNEEG